MDTLQKWLWRQFSEATVQLAITATITALVITAWTATRDAAPSMTSLGWLLVAALLAFSIVLLVGVAGWAKSRWLGPAINLAAATPSATDTRLRLHYYGTKRIPQQITQTNIWRWFSLEAIGHVRNPDGTTSDRSLHTMLSIVFDYPASFAQIVVSSPNMPLPLYQVRDHSSRHAIIQFEGEIGFGELEIRAIQ